MSPRILGLGVRYTRHGDTSAAPFTHPGACVTVVIATRPLGVCVSCVERLWLVLSKLLWFWLSWGLSFTVQFSLPVPYIMPDERYAIKQQGGYLASYTASGPDLQPIWHLQPISARR